MYYSTITEFAERVFHANISCDVANDISYKLLKQDNTKLNDIHNSKGMHSYIYKAVLNEKMDSYRTINSSSLDNLQIAYHDLSSSATPEMIMGCLDEYELKLIAVYCESKSIVDMCRKYGFRRATISEELKRIKEKIKSNIELV